MKCWHCDSEAKAVCVFCGRAICATHHQSKKSYGGYVRVVRLQVPETGTLVRNASWCGVCDVEYTD